MGSLSPPTTRSPEPRIESPLIVLILVPETSSGCTPVSVLLAMLIVLLVRVCVPVNVATDESIATVTAAEPL